MRRGWGAAALLAALAGAGRTQPIFDTFGRSWTTADPVWAKNTGRFSYFPGLSCELVTRCAEFAPAGSPTRLDIFCETVGGVAYGGQVVTKALLRHGSYRARLRAGGALPNLEEGCVNGFFYWCSEAEIDFEFRTHFQGTMFPGVVDLVLHHTPAAGAPTHLHFPTILDFDPSQGFHVYGFDWRSDRVEFYIDDRLVRTVTNAQFPVAAMPAGKLYFNHWTNHPTWGGLQPSSRVTFSVDWAAYSPCFFTSDRREISAAAGGAATLTLEAGAALGGYPFVIVGSLAAIDRGMPLGGMLLPLDWHWSMVTLLELLPGLVGILDAKGEAVVRALALPAQADPALAGLTFNLAGLVIDPKAGRARAVTQPLPVSIVR